jgi:hypothetical protein
LGTLYCPTGPLGTWSLSFKNDTDITLTAPNGGSTNLVMPAESAALFGTGPVRPYFGNQPNSESRRGQFTTFSRIQITGVAVPIDDSFPGPDLNQDPANVPWQWQKQADDPNGVFVSSGTDVHWVKWTLPDTGFVLQGNPGLQASGWKDLALTRVPSFGTQKAALLPAADLPSAGAGFVRLLKQ